MVDSMCAGLNQLSRVIAFKNGETAAKQPRPRTDADSRGGNHEKRPEYRQPKSPDHVFASGVGVTNTKVSRVRSLKHLALDQSDRHLAR
jgi:hypothetical protein